MAAHSIDMSIPNIDNPSLIYIYIYIYIYIITVNIFILSVLLQSISHIGCLTTVNLYRT